MFFGEAVGLGLSAIGLGTSIFGGAQQDSAAQKAADAAYKYDTQVWKYNWKEAKRDYNYAKKSRNIAIKNNENELAYREETAKRDWQYGMAIRDVRNRTAQRQWQQSEANFKKQLSFNNLAAAEAYESANRQFREIGIAQAFQSQDQMVAEIQETGKGLARGQAGRSAAKTMQSSLAAYGRNVAIMEESMRSAKAQHVANIRGINLKKLEADLAAEAARMLKPEMEPALPEPLAMPRTIFQKPQKPKKPPKPIKYAAGGGNTLGAIAGAFDTLGGINWGSFGKPSQAAQQVTNVTAP